MEQVRLGIIGIGGMGSGHAKSIVDGKVPEMRLTAVADIREARREWAARELPLDVAVYSDGRNWSTVEAVTQC